jgi:hypothetical protein
LANPFLANGLNVVDPVAFVAAVEFGEVGVVADEDKEEGSARATVKREPEETEVTFRP